SDVKNPRTIRSQSRQKYAIIPIAVATCSPTTNARYGESGEDTFSVLAQFPPISAGRSTLCPRLETGKSSVTPWMRPVTTASRYVRCWDINALPFRYPWGRKTGSSRTSAADPGRPTLTQVGWPTTAQTTGTLTARHGPVGAAVIIRHSAWQALTRYNFYRLVEGSRRKERMAANARRS